MPDCIMCDNSRKTGAWVETKPIGSLAEVQEPYTAFLCPSCLRQLQQIAGYREEGLDVEDVERAHGSDPERSST